MAGACGEQQVVLGQIILAKVTGEGSGERDSVVGAQRSSGEHAQGLMCLMEGIEVHTAGVESIHLMLGGQRLEHAVRRP